MIHVVSPNKVTAYAVVNESYREAFAFEEQLHARRHVTNPGCT